MGKRFYFILLAIDVIPDYVSSLEFLSLKLFFQEEKMGLDIYQKSVYLTIFNETMIMRVIGKMLPNGEKKSFKKRLFEEIENLIDKMDNHKLKEKDILCSIDTISKKFVIPFGLAQKPINTILKYHFYLFYSRNNQNVECMKKQLHCPLDSVVLNELIKESKKKQKCERLVELIKKIKNKENKLRITNIDKCTYLKIQRCLEIISEDGMKISFDRIWDKKHLEDAGIL